LDTESSINHSAMRVRTPCALSGAPAGIHDYLQYANGASLRVEEGRALLQAPEGQDRHGYSASTGRMTEKARNNDPDWVLAGLDQLAHVETEASDDVAFRLQ